MATPALLGVDVGFSKSRKTTGLAWFAGSTIETALTGSSWSERSSSLPRDAQFAIVALDAPIAIVCPHGVKTNHFVRPDVLQPRRFRIESVNFSPELENFLFHLEQGSII